MIYRSEPLQNGLSPAQMLMGGQICTNLTIHEDLLMSTGASTVKGKKQIHRDKQKQHYDKNTKPQQGLKPGDKIHILNIATGMWMQQCCVEREFVLCSYEIWTEQL